MDGINGIIVFGSLLIGGLIVGTLGGINKVKKGGWGWSGEALSFWMMWIGSIGLFFSVLVWLSIHYN